MTLITFNAIAARTVGDRQQGGADIDLQGTTRFASWMRSAQKAGDFFRRGGA
jgi:hypothetical protein